MRWKMAERKVRFMAGNYACAEGALYAGLNFYAGYPITPSSEIAEYLSEQLPKRGGAFIEMEDEIGSMGAVIGASLSGAKAMTATSGPGFSLMQEHIGFAALTGTPCVIVNVMRGGPSTGYPTGPSQSDVMQARWGTHGDHPIIAVSPTSVQECFTETVRAFNLAEKFRTPVIFLSDEIVGHMREKIVFPEPGEIEVINRKKPTCPPEEYKPFYYEKEGDVPPLPAYGEGYRFHITGLNYDETGFPTNNGEIIERMERFMMAKIYKHLDEIIKVEEWDCGNCDVLIIAYGSTFRSAKSVYNTLKKEGMKVGLLKIMTIWPFPDRYVKDAARKAKLVVVPEMNLGQLILEVDRCIKTDARIVGVNSINTEPISPSMILKKIKENSDVL
jgi:2-oxoglutarate ferredoxin oxidoreductase subunit alpha